MRAAVGLLFLYPATLVAVAAPGQTAISTWKDGAKAAVSITMDDGYASQWRIMSRLLASRGFRGTFFVVTDWVDREDHWAKWREVAETGHEIGSHGVTHDPMSSMDPKKLSAELADSRRRIQDRIGATHGRTLAYPESSATAELARAAALSGYEAARTGGIAYNPPSPKDFHQITSMHPLRGTPLWEMNSWVDDIQEKGGWLVVGVHGITDPDSPSSPTQEGWEAIPQERYVAFVDHLAAARPALWVAPFGEVARYIKARDAAAVSTRRVTRDAIEIVMEGDPGGPLLTLDTAVPAHWAEVKVTGSGDGPLVLPARREGSVRLVRYDAAPPATIRLAPAAIAAASPNP